MNEQPKLSVLVVTHNKPQLCTQLLQSIAMAKDTPSSTEFLVYHSGSLGGHVQGPEGFRCIVLEDNLNLGASIGFNTLLSLARGEYILMANDDMIANVNGWFLPLVEALADASLGVACAEIIQGGKNFSTQPSLAEMGNNIQNFSDAYKGVLDQPNTVSYGASNHPWLFKRELVSKFDAQSPIVNEGRWISNWIDPTGCFWHVDWACMCFVQLAGYKVGVVPQSVFYHYDHATLKEKDAKEPGWTNISRERYFKLFQTFDKVVVPPRKVRIVGQDLVPA